MRKRAGYILMGIAVLHEVVGLAFYSEALVEIAQAGVVNAVVPPYWQRDAAFWFLMFGVLLFLIGWVAQWALDEVGYVPSFIGWGVLLMCAVGIVFMPASGLWLGLPVAWMMLRTRQSNAVSTA